MSFPQVFVDYFGGGIPVKKVSGRAFPMDVVWEDKASEESNFENYTEAAVKKALDIHKNEAAGDILVFLTSAQEIQKCCDMFTERLRGTPKNFEVGMHIF
jgi:HrpA-like RNA helicase